MKKLLFFLLLTTMLLGSASSALASYHGSQPIPETAGETLIAKELPVIYVLYNDYAGYYIVHPARQYGGK